MDLLLGAKLSALKGGKSVRGDMAGDGAVLRLPVTGDAKERLQMALGAAAALKAQRGGRVLLIYVGAGEVSKKEWKRALSAAGKRELPVIFVVLPGVEEKSAKRAGELCGRSRGWGVPGFPVDGKDAIGMYRVMQESLLRARAGGGSVLIECVGFRLHGDKGSGHEDPVERLGALMVQKGAATAEWIKATRLAAGRRVRAS